eukprot:7296629-Heterocapsa_arctica.AAC.1
MHNCAFPHPTGSPHLPTQMRFSAAKRDLLPRHVARQLQGGLPAARPVARRHRGVAGRRVARDPALRH